MNTALPLKRYNPSIDDSTLTPDGAGQCHLVMAVDQEHGYYVTYEDALQYAETIRDEAIQAYENAASALPTQEELQLVPNIDTSHEDNARAFLGTSYGNKEKDIEMNNSKVMKELPKWKIEEVLEQRGSTYGEFSDNAWASQVMKDFMKSQAGWGSLNNVQREALEVIAQKISRILNGNPNYKDNWVDIQGYAELVLKDIMKNNLV